MTCSRARAVLLVASLAVLACEASGPRRAAWHIQFDGDALASRAVAVEATIREGSCAVPGRTLYATELLPGARAMTPPALPVGAYAFGARARDSSCLWYASGCADVRVPDHDLAQVTLAPSMETSTCAGGRICTDGRCAAPDAGPPPVDGGRDDWLGPAWAYRKELRVRSVLIAADLADFPLLVSLEPDVDLALHAQDDGGDIVFTTADGVTRLAHELEHFDGATGALTAWVLVPMLAAPSDSVVYVYYGNPSAPPQDTPDAVWGDRYAGVWHMSGAPPAPIVDSTAAGHHAAPPGTISAPASAEGRIHRALAFDGVDDKLLVGDPPDGSLDFGTSSFSYSCWVLVAMSAGSWDMPIFKGGSSLGAIGWDMELGLEGWSFFLSDGVSVIGTYYGTEATFLGGWVHLVAVVDREAGRSRSYVNGVMIATSDISALGTLDTDRALYLGASSGGSSLLGTLDEVRVVRRALTSEWIAAEHANQAAPASFFSVGPAEAR